MPYATLPDLPKAVRFHLPRHAQEIFLAAFNHAYDSYRARNPARHEEIARRVAWAAVKKRYVKRDEIWVEKNREDA